MSQEGSHRLFFCSTLTVLLLLSLPPSLHLSGTTDPLRHPRLRRCCSRKETLAHRPPPPCPHCWRRRRNPIIRPPRRSGRVRRSIEPPRYASGCPAGEAEPGSELSSGGQEATCGEHGGGPGLSFPVFLSSFCGGCLRFALSFLFPTFLVRSFAT